MGSSSRVYIKSHHRTCAKSKGRFGLRDPATGLEVGAKGSGFSGSMALAPHINQTWGASAIEPLKPLVLVSGNCSKWSKLCDDVEERGWMLMFMMCPFHPKCLFVDVAAPRHQHHQFSFATTGTHDASF